MSATALAFALLGSAACSSGSPTKRTDYPTLSASAAPEIAHLSTFRLAQPPGVVPQPRADSLIRTRIAQTLAGKGYAQPIEGEADFLVRYGLATRDRGGVAFTTVAYRGPFRAGQVQVARVRTYKQGQLFIEIIDARTGKSLWHTVATGTATNVGEALTKIDRAVVQLLSPVPVRRAQ